MVRRSVVISLISLSFALVISCSEQMSFETETEVVEFALTTYQPNMSVEEVRATIDAGTVWQGRDSTLGFEAEGIAYEFGLDDGKSDSARLDFKFDDSGLFALYINFAFPKDSSVESQEYTDLKEALLSHLNRTFGEPSGISDNSSENFGSITVQWSGANPDYFSSYLLYLTNVFTEPENYQGPRITFYLWDSNRDF